MNRTAHVIAHEWSQQYRNITMIAGAVAGTIMLFGMLTWIDGFIEVLNLWETYPTVMIVVGTLITTQQFGELRSPGHRIAYLLRPATVWEKALGKILISLLFVWLAVTVAFVVVSLLGVMIYLLTPGSVDAGRAFFIAFDGGEWWRMASDALWYYLPVHAVFFFGSAYFKKHNAGRTLLAAVGWIASYAVIGVLSVRLIFGRYVTGDPDGTWTGSGLNLHFGSGKSLMLNETAWEQIVPWYLKDPEVLGNVLLVAAVIVFWLLTVLRLRETEA